MSRYRMKSGDIVNTAKARQSREETINWNGNNQPVKTAGTVPVGRFNRHTARV